MNIHQLEQLVIALEQKDRLCTDSVEFLEHLVLNKDTELDVDDTERLTEILMEIGK